MSAQISGTYEGEGPNVSGTLSTANVPDVQAASTNATTTGQGRGASIAADRRRRLRVSSEGARAAVAIAVSSADQQLANYSRGVYISTGGNLVVRLVDDTADATFTGLVAGQWYPLCVAIVRKTGTTAAGLLLM